MLLACDGGSGLAGSGFASFWTLVSAACAGGVDGTGGAGSVARFWTPGSAACATDAPLGGVDGTGGARTKAPGALEASPIGSSFTLVADAAALGPSDGQRSWIGVTRQSPRLQG